MPSFYVWLHFQRVHNVFINSVYALAVEHLYNGQRAAIAKMPFYQTVYIHTAD